MQWSPLEIAKSVVEAHGGRIRCDINGGDDITFFFMLPQSSCAQSAPRDIIVRLWLVSLSTTPSR